MKIRRIQIRHFRNLDSIELFPSTGLSWFFGPNGQGKTNLLEALYVALRGRSFRPYSSKSDWSPLPANGARPEIRMEILDERGFTTECSFGMATSGSWEATVNGKRISIGRVRSLIPIVAFSPDDHALIRWEPEVRRNFLDDMMSDVGPGYAEAHHRYQEALKSRNRLLKSFEGKLAATVQDELIAWSETLANCGLELSKMRREMWPSFERNFLSIVEKLFEGTGSRLELSFAQDYEGPLSGESCLEHMLTGLQKDLDTGWTHRGPHRDDFHVILNGADSRSTASQGQSRLIALALKWAHGSWVYEERDELPVFLVDDFSSEFDAQRREALLSFLRSTKGQVFVTGTDRSLVDSGTFCDYNLYSVRRGVVEPAKTHGEMNV